MFFLLLFFHNSCLYNIKPTNSYTLTCLSSIIYCKNSIFYDLKSFSNGGGLICTVSNYELYINYCYFTKCSSSIYGGGIFTTSLKIINIDFSTACKCYSDKGHFLCCGTSSNGESNISMISAIFCPLNFEGTHQTIRLEYGNQKFENINISNSYMNGHSLLLSCYSINLNMFFNTLISSTTSIIIETYLCSGGNIENINIFNNSKNNENYAIIHLNQGNYLCKNILIKLNYNFNNNLNLLGGSTINNNEIFLLNLNDYTLILNHFLKGFCLNSLPQTLTKKISKFNNFLILFLKYKILMILILFCLLI